MPAIRIWFVLRWKTCAGWKVEFWADSEADAIAERDRLLERYDRVIVAIGQC